MEKNKLYLGKFIIQSENEIIGLLNHTCNYFNIGKFVLLLNCLETLEWFQNIYELLE